MTWAHPHSRGENLYTLAYKRKRAGSSPLTRGKLLHIDGAVTLAGLIPTHAGKTYFISVSPRRAWAHPHSRGENTSPMPRLKFDVGSSPLTRGKPYWPAWVARMRRLIPTHAGKTHPRRPRARHAGAHPHSRGENEMVMDGASSLPGSSPLTRGKHFLTCAFIAQIGQILESLELCASSESYSLMDAYATDAPQDQVRSTGLAPRRSRDAS